jgi:hypothetical protein
MSELLKACVKSLVQSGFPTDKIVPALKNAEATAKSEGQHTKPKRY